MSKTAENPRCSLVVSVILRKKSKDNGKVVAELSFGFWPHLFDKKFQKENFKMIKSIFPFRSSWDKNLALSISQIHSDISKIHKLRNRIAHHEPIFHYKNLQQQYDHIIKTLKLINPACEKLIDQKKFYSLISGGWGAINIPG